MRVVFLPAFFNKDSLTPKSSEQDGQTTSYMFLLKHVHSTSFATQHCTYSYSKSETHRALGCGARALCLRSHHTPNKHLSVVPAPDAIIYIYPTKDNPPTSCHYNAIVEHRAI